MTEMSHGEIVKVSKHVMKVRKTLMIFHLIDRISHNIRIDHYRVPKIDDMRTDIDHHHSFFSVLFSMVYPNTTYRIVLI